MCEYFAELGKAPRPALQVLKALCARGTTETSRMPAWARQLVRGWRRGPGQVVGQEEGRRWVKNQLLTGGQHGGGTGKTGDR